MSSPLIKKIRIKPAIPVAILSTTTSVNVFVFFLISIGMGMESNSVAALFTDCFKLPSTILINTTTHSCGTINNRKDPNNMPEGSHRRDLPTPKVPTIRLVRNNCINSEITLRVENQNPKKEVNSS